MGAAVTHDRIHAREPTHHVDRWSIGTVETPDGEAVELVVTLAIRDLFVSRLDLDDGDTPVGERVWYREHGG